MRSLEELLDLFGDASIPELHQWLELWHWEWRDVILQPSGINSHILLWTFQLFFFIQIESLSARNRKYTKGETHNLLVLSSSVSSETFGKTLVLFDHHSAYFLLLYSFDWLISSMPPKTLQKLLKIICWTSHHEDYSFLNKYLCGCTHA